jgi:periplasmic protein TonB
LRPRTLGGRPEDRLATAIFVAAVLHGLLILGVRFAAPRPDNRPLPTLEVLLVPDGTKEAANPSATYLSSRDQRGAGTGRDKQRTSLPEASASLLEQSGEAEGKSFSPAAIEPEAGGVARVSSATAQGRSVAPTTEIEYMGPASVPMASRPRPQVGVNSSAAEESLHLRGETSPDDKLLADTRESQIAAYLDGWKRRVEQVGTSHFPEAARRRGATGNPVLEVAIRADGSLQQVLLRRTSGHREIDNAALGIVRLAAPFEPFPPAVRTRYPVLRFAYEWQFQSGRAASGALSATQP